MLQEDDNVSDDVKKVLSDRKVLTRDIAHLDEDAYKKSYAQTFKNFVTGYFDD
jgi:hypothetical protein